MITLLVLLTVIAVLVVLSALVVLATGAIGLVLFGDLIVAIIIIVWFVKRIIRKKK